MRWRSTDTAARIASGPWREDSFFPAEYGPVIQKVGEEEVPNGMVAQNLYSPAGGGLRPGSQQPAADADS